MSETQEPSQQMRQLVVMGRHLIGEDRLEDAMEVAERDSKNSCRIPCASGASLATQTPDLL